jgi:hypothetical protein
VNCKVESREAVTDVIPSLIKLLEDKAKEIRCETVELIDKLANHGEWKFNGICFKANAGYEVEFWEAITRSIQSIMQLGRDSDKHVRSASARLVINLANRGG